MTTTRITVPATQPVLSAFAKKYLKVNGDSQNEVIELALNAAWRFIEEQTNRVLAPTQFRFASTCWDGPFVLPKRPVRDVLAMSFLDSSGIEQPVDEAEYVVEFQGDGKCAVYLKSSFSRLALYSDARDRVFVDFAAGYDDPEQSGSGDNPELKLPGTAKITLLMFTEHWFQNRGVARENDLKPFAMASESLLAQLQVFNA